MEEKRAVTFEDSTADWEAQHSHAKRYLMVIGINKYKDREITSLSNAQRDAAQVRDLLTNLYGFEPENQVVLYDESASIKNITFHLRELSKKVKATDSLLIYFAGHGFLDKATQIGYLIPADAQKGEIHSYLPNSTVLDLVRAIKSLHTFLVLDSCFSGALLRKRDFDDSSEDLAENMEKYPSRIALAAGMIETVADGYYNENSPFAKAFMKRLENNTQRKLPASEVIQFVKRAVPGNAKQQPCSGTIFDTGDLQGEFVFYRKDGVSPAKKTAVEGNKTAYRETEVEKNFVEKVSHFFQNNKITGSIILLCMGIIGIGGVIEGVKSITELGQKDKVKDTLYVQPVNPKHTIQPDADKEPKNPAATEPKKIAEKTPTKQPTVKPKQTENMDKKPIPAETPIVVKEPEKIQFYEATLSVNAAFSKAEIFVDGKPAEVLSNTLSIKKIRIPMGNHTITLKANGKECNKTQSISSNSKLVMTCD